jgi:hypothetical protein
MLDSQGVDELCEKSPAIKVGLYSVSSIIVYSLRRHFTVTPLCDLSPAILPPQTQLTDSTIVSQLTADAPSLDSKASTTTAITTSNGVGPIAPTFVPPGPGNLPYV